MKYLSKGLLLRRFGETLAVSHCGSEYELYGEQASVWMQGRLGLGTAAGICRVRELGKLAEKGLAEISESTGGETLFRLLSNCVICPAKGAAATFLWSQEERRLWRWLAKAGLRLTIAEMVSLNDKGLRPTAGLLGESNRQSLTEAIYTAKTISGGMLEPRMEQSPARDGTVGAVMGLLRKRKIILL